ncbi:MAG TPA: hypothetical protein VEI97_12470, partial [bacterium]|nr:hypothetical protein [bacterium]
VPREDGGGHEKVWYPKNPEAGLLLEMIQKGHQEVRNQEALTRVPWEQRPTSVWPQALEKVLERLDQEALQKQRGPRYLTLAERWAERNDVSGHPFENLPVLTDDLRARMKDLAARGEAPITQEDVVAMLEGVTSDAQIAKFLLDPQDAIEDPTKRLGLPALQRLMGQINAQPRLGRAYLQLLSLYHGDRVRRGDETTADGDPKYLTDQERIAGVWPAHKKDRKLRVPLYQGLRQILPEWREYLRTPEEIEAWNTIQDFVEKRVQKGEMPSDFPGRLPEDLKVNDDPGPRAPLDAWMRDYAQESPENKKFVDKNYQPRVGGGGYPKNIEPDYLNKGFKEALAYVAEALEKRMMPRSEAMRRLLNVVEQIHPLITELRDYWGSPPAPRPTATGVVMYGKRMTDEDLGVPPLEKLIEQERVVWDLAHKNFGRAPGTEEDIKRTALERQERIRKELKAATADSSHYPHAKDYQTLNLAGLPEWGGVPYPVVGTQSDPLLMDLSENWYSINEMLKALVSRGTDAEHLRRGMLREQGFRRNFENLGIPSVDYETSRPRDPEILKTEVEDLAGERPVEWVETAYNRHTGEEYERFIYGPPTKRAQDAARLARCLEPSFETKFPPF